MNEPLTTPQMMLLLLSKENGANRVASGGRAWPTTAATLFDLAAANRISFTEDRSPRVRLLDPTPLGDPVLDGALATVARFDGKGLARAFTAVNRGIEKRVGEQLVAEGVVTRQPAFIGLGSRWPATSPARVAALRDGLTSALLRGEGSAQQAALLAIAAQLRSVGLVVDADRLRLGGVTRRQAAKQAAALRIIGGGPDAVALTRTLKALQTAVLVAATAAGGAAAAGGG